MKLYSLSMLCLSLLLLNTPFSLTKGRGGSGRSSSGKKPSSGSRSSSNTGYKPNKGSTPQGGHPKQNNQGSPGQQGNYPRQPGAGGNPNQYPRQGSPYGGYGGGSYGGYGGGYGGYGRGYGGYGGGYGGPSEKSKGFARSAVIAATGGMVAGTALGYGLGSFPRPHFNVRSPQEEYYYNHYMYRNYGSQSTSINTKTNTKANTNTNTKTSTNANTNTNEYSRDKAGHVEFTQSVQSYDDYMDHCMNSSDILPAKTQKPQNKPGATATAMTKTNTSTAVTSESNNTATENPLTPTPSSPGPPNQPEDDDTVSIVEIGYPALIEQAKTRRCLELYMAYPMRQEGHEDWSTGGVERLEMGFRRLLALLTSAILILLNSNVSVLLH